MSHHSTHAAYASLPRELQVVVDVLTRHMEREVEELRSEIQPLQREVASLRKRFTELLLTRSEAAERLCCSERTIIRLEERGELERVSGVPGVGTTLMPSIG